MLLIAYVCRSAIEKASTEAPGEEVAMVNHNKRKIWTRIQMVVAGVAESASSNIVNTMMMSAAVTG